ncbi:hypothetical protein OO009_10290 [Flavobacteriaceae bacterium KMM 6897]|nr:hypothetical protein [Flavobacteriaceae bacterium KMM 6897]MEB8344696.1 hypothetical protein [Flavobacteriaceae bacterium KMM 6898]
MVTFFNILITLVAINAILLIFSVNRSNKKNTVSADTKLDGSATKIYPMDLSSSNYKKAI